MLTWFLRNSSHTSYKRASSLGDCIWSVSTSSSYIPPLSPSLFLNLSPPQAHEFVDEQAFEQNNLETALQSYTSPSPSPSSSHGESTSTCCGCRARRKNTALPEPDPGPSPGSKPPYHHHHPQRGPLQELSAVHIQCVDPASHKTRWDVWNISLARGCLTVNVAVTKCFPQVTIRDSFNSTKRCHLRALFSYLSILNFLHFEFNYLLIIFSLNIFS